MGPLTELEGSIFGIKPLKMRPYEFYDDIHVTLSFEFDLNRARIEREVYNMMDLLGDLGGLKTALLVLLAYLNSFVNYHSFEDYLVSNLFRPSKKSVK